MFLKESTRILFCCPGPPVSGANSLTCPTSSCPGTRRGWHCDQYSGSRRRDVGDISNLKFNCLYIRHYASVPGPSSKRSHSAGTGYTWPTSPCPTPYEVLAHSRNAQYNKAIFYELVKIYHPDRTHVAANLSVPYAVRLERYRLVVAANEILSNDAKRRAYDLYGAGWNGKCTMDSLYREADRSWRNRPGNASRNATWEDWERWRHEKNGSKPPQSPLFMSNELFVFVLCFFVVMGSVAQGRRAGTTTLTVVELRDQKHVSISDSMRRLQDEKAPLSRRERVDNFVRQRESWNMVALGDIDSGSPSSDVVRNPS